MSHNTRPFTRCFLFFCTFFAVQCVFLLFRLCVHSCDHSNALALARVSERNSNMHAYVYTCISSRNPSRRVGVTQGAVQDDVVQSAGGPHSVRDCADVTPSPPHVHCVAHKASSAALGIVARSK